MLWFVARTVLQPASHALLEVSVLKIRRMCFVVVFQGQKWFLRSVCAEAFADASLSGWQVLFQGSGRWALRNS
jgi:hypothetical protein